MLVQLFLLSLAFTSAHFERNCTKNLEKQCQGKGRHVLCQYPQASPGENCKNYTKVSFEKELRDLVTNFINRRRQNVAAGMEMLKGGAILPQPGFMMMVEWDDDLAFLAQRLADQCLFIHDECRATERYPYAGQTVGAASWGNSGTNAQPPSSLEAIRGVLRAWWGEKGSVTPQRMFEPFTLRIRKTEEVWGDFAQLSLSRLTSVGCGAMRLSTRLILVCDYSHTNMLGETTLYGGPLGLCPEGTERGGRFPLLCAKIRENEKHFKKEHVEAVLNETEVFHESHLPKIKQILSRRDRLQTKLKYKTTTSQAPDMRTQKMSPAHRRWKENREKQQRPGASALLKSKPSRSRATLMLDKDDIDQLFEDTGFQATVF